MFPVGCLCQGVTEHSGAVSTLLYRTHLPAPKFPRETSHAKRAENACQLLGQCLPALPCWVTLSRLLNFPPVFLSGRGIGHQHNLPPRVESAVFTVKDLERTSTLPKVMECSGQDLKAPGPAPSTVIRVRPHLLPEALPDHTLSPQKSLLSDSLHCGFLRTCATKPKLWAIRS